MKQRKTKFVKAAIIKPVMTTRRRRPNSKAANPGPKSEKRDNIFSKYRNPRKDRGPRQMNATHDSQTVFRLCALL